MLFCFRVLVTSFSLLRLSVRWIRHAIAADDSLFSFGWRICVGAARIFGTSPTAAHDRSCTRHRKILHSMEGMQTINLFFFVWSCASLVFLIIDCFMYEPRAFVFWVFFYEFRLLWSISNAQRRRYLNRLAIRLPSTSPTCREWPNVTLFLRDTNQILKKLYHVWRVSFLKKEEEICMFLDA